MAGELQGRWADGRDRLYRSVVLQRLRRPTVTGRHKPRKSEQNRALLRRRSAPGLIFHSDRGVEFSAYAFIESFFHTLKADVIHGHVFDNDHALRMAISHYTRRYNRTRMHSALDYRSPIDYERIAA